MLLVKFLMCTRTDRQTLLSCLKVSKGEGTASFACQHRKFNQGFDVSNLKRSHTTREPAQFNSRRDTHSTVKGVTWSIQASHCQGARQSNQGYFERKSWNVAFSLRENTGEPPWRARWSTQCRTWGEDQSKGIRVCVSNAVLSPLCVGAVHSRLDHCENTTFCLFFE